MNKIFILTFLGSIVTCWVYIQAQHANRSANTLAKMNIAALSDTTPARQQICTRAIAWGNCYKEDGSWHSIIVTMVEEYEPSSIMIECRHDVITHCPPGTNQKNI